MDDKKGIGVKKWNHAVWNMSVLLKTEKKEFYRLIALIQIMENPVALFLYPNSNFLKALRMYTFLKDYKKIN